jgi:hypothetical protein
MRFCDAALALQAHACGWRVHDIKAEIFKAKGDDKQAEAEKAIMLEYIKGKDKEGTPEWLAMYYGDIIRNDLAKGKVFQAKKKFQEVIAKLLEQQKTLLSSSDNSRDEQNISRIVEAFQNARDNIKDNNDDAQAQYSLLPRSRKVKKINTSDESLRSNDSSTCDTPSTSSIYDTTYIFDEESSRDEAVISNKESEEQINKAIEETRNTLTLLDYKNLEEALILVRQEIKVMQDTMSHQNSLLSTVTHDLNAVKSEVGDITSYLEELKEHQSRVEAMHEMPKNYELQEYWKAFILTVMQTYSSAGNPPIK